MKDQSSDRGHVLLPSFKRAPAFAPGLFFVQGRACRASPQLLLPEHLHQMQNDQEQNQSSNHFHSPTSFLRATGPKTIRRGGGAETIDRTEVRSSREPCCTSRPLRDDFVTKQERTTRRSPASADTAESPERSHRPTGSARRSDRPRQRSLPKFSRSRRSLRLARLRR